MIQEYDEVIINESGIRGTVIDIYKAQGIVFYTVESDERGVPGGWGQDDNYKLFTCRIEELTKI